ncbi:MAG: DUF1573 domain-containing protein [Verrucomicrobiota bacterium]
MSIATRLGYLVSTISMLVVGTAAFALEPPLPVPGPAPAAGGAPVGTRPLPPGMVLPGTTANPVAGTSPTNISGPKIQFDATVYDFGKVMSGEQVKHTFYFTNTGCQDLILNNVQAACGCTVVGDWARQVKPGDSGHIPVAFNTSNYSYPVTKVIQVICNDRSQSGGAFPLQLKGVVWKPINVIPAAASLLLRSDAPYASATVRITNSLEQLLVLSAPESSNPLFGAELRTNTFGREYQVIISNTAALPPGNLQGHISLKTSVTNIPVIDITAWANSQPPLSVVPMRIDLRQAPLATNQLAYVTIINNGTNPITVSEPSVDAAAVDVTVTQTQPGRYFTILLKFPTGFELPAGRPGTFTIKTTHPRVPLVKVPIYQAARSAARSAPVPVVLKRPAPPFARPAAVVPQPPRPSAPLAPSPVSLPADTGSASSTNRPPPPPMPNFP